MKVGIINIGIGNIASIKNMLLKLGYDSEYVSKPNNISYDWIILPGVGAFDNGVKKLQETGWFSFLKNDDAILSRKTSLLGICLGMQLLTEGSEEGCLEGLNLIPGYFKKFSFENSDKKYPVPHMGWDEVKFNAPLERLNCTEYGLSRFYFVHSYYYNNIDTKYVMGTTNYGFDFVSAINDMNIYGVQFHPEKSHQFGKSLFKELIK